MLTEAEKKAAKEKADKKAAEEAARKAKLKEGEEDPDDDEEEEQEEETEDDPAPDESKLGFTKEQKAYVDGLRKENAKARIKNKELDSKLTGLNDRFGKLEGGLKKLFGDEDNDLPPEKKIEKLQQQNEQLAMATALKEAALEHGVGKADYEYFEFLVSKKMSGLKEGEELSEDDLAKLAKAAKAKNAAKSTSVDTDGDPDPDEESDEISLEQFMALGIGARSAIYQKDKPLYEKLVAAEKAAKKKK